MIKKDDNIEIFHKYIQTGDIDNTQAMLTSNKQIVNQMHNGFTPLSKAVAYCPKLIPLLFEHGADVRCEPNGDENAMVQAAWRCSFDIINQLMKCGLKLDSYRYHEIRLSVYTKFGNAFKEEWGKTFLPFHKQSHESIKSIISQVRDGHHVLNENDLKDFESLFGQLDVKMDYFNFLE
ncbi:MAG: hypothetical protein DGJ47_000267 [Rickettsiaceae bacterium]